MEDRFLLFSIDGSHLSGICGLGVGRWESIVNGGAISAQFICLLLSVRTIIKGAPSRLTGKGDTHKRVRIEDDHGV